MKKILLFFAVLVTCLSMFAFEAYADVFVNGYFRKDGTYVKPHYRTDPDSSPYNNYSYPGNYNPNTGTITPGNADTYLENYYKNKTYTPTTYPSITYPTTTPTYTTTTPSYTTYPSSSYNNTVTEETGDTATYQYNYFNNKTNTDYSTNLSCPENSYYNYIYDKCMCNSGYYLEKGVCKSAVNYCVNKYGSGAKYNFLTGKCDCKSGYGAIKDSQGNQTCVSGEVYCVKKYGTDAEYNSITNKCVYPTSNLKPSATSYSFVSFDPFNYKKNKKGYYYLTGKTSDNCEKIIITPKNHNSYIDEDPYQLQAYQLGDTTFSYNLSNKFKYSEPNMATGFNEYTVTAYCGGLPAVVTDEKLIYFNESML